MVLAGNDQADFAAKAALNSSQTLQLSDIRVRVKNMNVQWQALYDNETKGMHCKAIAPVVGQKPSFLLALNRLLLTDFNLVTVYFECRVSLLSRL